MSESIAQAWLKAAAETASNHDHAAHMALISKRVALRGVPGFEVIDYEAWSSQCQREFAQRLIQSVSYDGLRLLAHNDNRVMFKTFETVEAGDGKVNAQGIEVVLEREADGVWRLLQERVLTAAEAAREGLGAAIAEVGGAV